MSEKLRKKVSSQPLESGQIFSYLEDEIGH